MAMPDGLDEFTQGYLVAALWSTNDESDESGGEPMDKTYDFDDIAPEALEKIKADCAKFTADNGQYINREHCLNYSTTPEARAGHDFWLTRNGHGAGFWDGDWSKESEAVLTVASKKFGEVNPYVGDDGKLYGFGE